MEATDYLRFGLWPSWPIVHHVSYCNTSGLHNIAAYSWTRLVDQLNYAEEILGDRKRSFVIPVWRSEHAVPRFPALRADTVPRHLNRDKLCCFQLQSFYLSGTDHLTVSPEGARSLSASATEHAARKNPLDTTYPWSGLDESSESHRMEMAQYEGRHGAGARTDSMELSAYTAPVAV